MTVLISFPDSLKIAKISQDQWFRPFPDNMTLPGNIHATFREYFSRLTEHGKNVEPRTPSMILSEICHSVILVNSQVKQKYPIDSWRSLSHCYIHTGWRVLLIEKLHTDTEGAPFNQRQKLNQGLIGLIKQGKSKIQGLLRLNQRGSFLELFTYARAKGARNQSFSKKLWAGKMEHSRTMAKPAKIGSHYHRQPFSLFITGFFSECSQKPRFESPNKPTSEEGPGNTIKHYLGGTLSWKESK